MLVLDDSTRQTLSDYVREVSSLANETAKRQAFTSLITELFPKTSAKWELAKGAEHRIEILSQTERRRRYVDTYYGQYVIEFETSLKKSLKTAEAQLREYVAGVLNERNSKIPVVAIATDGLQWEIYYPRESEADGDLRADQIRLESVCSFTVTNKADSLRSFWIWLTTLLFREARITPTAERFKMDFGSASPAFVDARAKLMETWESVREQREASLAFDKWRQYLTFTYGGFKDRPDQLNELFIKHSYLTALARFMVWAAFSQGRTKKSFAELSSDVLTGEYFRSWSIQNLVEDDFFQWMTNANAIDALSTSWEKLLGQLSGYDLSDISQDLLKGVYQELVDPVDRHDLGEYYTPDWLSEKIVEELLPDSEFASVLDPSCGSGTFLHAAIKHFTRKRKSADSRMLLSRILQNVAGIDIHPLAVTISKATYILTILPLIKEARLPVTIPVYLADSLFLPTEVRELLLGEETGYRITFGGKEVIIPDRLVRHSALFDKAIAAATRLAKDHAETGQESIDSLDSYLARTVKEMSKYSERKAMVRSLWMYAAALSELIRKRRNSIWSFIVRNGYRPAMLKEKFDFIVGNPPWLSYRYISDPDYQKEVKKRAIDEHSIAPRSQKLFTQMELATVFLAHTLTTFGKEGGRLAFVMPRSILSADQHDNLRQKSFSAPISLDAYWDLRDVQPVFRVPSCVLFCTKRREDKSGVSSYSLPATEWKGRLSHKDVSWTEAKESLTAAKNQANLIFLGNRSALSTLPGRRMPSEPSKYLSRFNQGATIVPRNCYFVQVKNNPEEIDPDAVYWVETEPEQARLAKPPYDEVKLAGNIEGRFLFRTALSKHVLPFALLDPAWVVLPVEEKEDSFQLLTADMLRQRGYREVAGWMSKVEQIWQEKRAAKSKSASVYEWLDYSNKLTAQDPSAKHIVLYNAAGTDISACTVDARDVHPAFVADAKTYKTDCKSASEAAYLCSFLNSRALNESIKPFQSLGLQGERDIHKKPLDLPIPMYTENKAEHRSLAKLGASANEQVSKLLSSTDLPNSLARQRALVRNHISDTLDEIDELVKDLLDLK